MSVQKVFACSYPAILIPHIGQGDENKIVDIKIAYERMAEEIKRLEAEIIVFISPLAPSITNKFYVSSLGQADFSFRKFKQADIKLTCRYDEAFSDQLKRACSQNDIETFSLPCFNSDMDEAMAIPLWYIQRKYRDFKVVRIGLSLDTFKKHEDLGRQISKIADFMEKRVVVVALAQLANHRVDSTNNKSLPEAARFDAEICRIFKLAELKKLKYLDPKFCLSSSGTDVRSFIIASGVLSQYEYTSILDGYQTGFGQGYIFASFTPNKMNKFEELDTAKSNTNLEIELRGANIADSSSISEKNRNTLSSEKATLKKERKLELSLAADKEKEREEFHNSYKEQADVSYDQGTSISSGDFASSHGSDELLENSNILNDRGDLSNISQKQETVVEKGRELELADTKIEKEFIPVSQSLLRNDMSFSSEYENRFVKKNSKAQVVVESELKADKSTKEFGDTQTRKDDESENKEIADINKINKDTKIEANGDDLRASDSQSIVSKKQEMDVNDKKASDLDKSLADNNRVSEKSLEREKETKNNSLSTDDKLAKSSEQASVKEASEDRTNKIKDARANIFTLPLKTDPYVELAIFAIRYYVQYDKVAPMPKKVPESMLNNRAACFVSVYLHEQLMGCIGTLEPRRDNIAEEIIYNSLAACKNDQRFSIKNLTDARKLRATVDILGQTEAVTNLGQLDPQKYGIVVYKGERKALLLPRLAGVNTIEEQLGIAAAKAGVDVRKIERVDRFTVERHM